MEYSFKLSELFSEEVTVVSNELIPVNCPGLKELQLGNKLVKARVTDIVNNFGQASAHAQGLHTVITNAEKLENGHDKLYVFCDFASNRVVGILKIGTKKLFLFDDAGVQHELNPLCILDFYIHESRQRNGAGKYLFDHMLREEQIPVTHFAVDCPSDKLVFFLRKHYNMTKILPQINNFVLFDGFFDNRSDYKGKVARWTGLDQITDRPMEGGFHFHKEISRMQDSLDYIQEHPHQNPDGRHQTLASERRHWSQMQDHSHPNCDAADLESNGDGNGERHWSGSPTANRKFPCVHETMAENKKQSHEPGSNHMRDTHYEHKFHTDEEKNDLNVSQDRHRNVSYLMALSDVNINGDGHTHLANGNMVTDPKGENELTPEDKDDEANPNGDGFGFYHSSNGDMMKNPQNLQQFSPREEIGPHLTQRRHQSQMKGMTHVAYDPSEKETKGDEHGLHHWSTGNQ